MELATKRIKDDIFTISWYMRGGVTAEELFHVYSAEDRAIINDIIKINIENTKKSGLPLL
jgi:hypothetical protein